MVSEEINPYFLFKLVGDNQNPGSAGPPTFLFTFSD
jgi:hypothetical protein